MNRLKIFLLTVLAVPVLAIIAAQAQVPGEYSFEKYGEKTKKEIVPGQGGDSSGLINGTSYAFSTQSGVPLEDMTGATTIMTPGGGLGGSTPLRALAFHFRFDGINYDTYSVNSNGFIRLGAVPTGSTEINALEIAANGPKIAPFWDSNCMDFTGRIYARTVGQPGGRKLVIEWYRFKLGRGFVTCAAENYGTFQLWLFEGSGRIQFVYGPNVSLSNTSNGGYSVGIQARAAGNVASVATFNSTVSYTSANNSQLDPIPQGRSYSFIPVVPAAPTGGSVTDVTQTTVRLNWTDNADDNTAYVVRRSTDNVNFTVAGEAGPDAGTFIDSGLAPSTQYFYRVNAATEGGYSTDLALSATTLPRRSFSSNPGGSGLWSDPATWAQGVVPASGDDVTIENGSSVTIDVPVSVWSLEVGTAGAAGTTGGADLEGGGASLVFEAASARAVTVRTNVHVASGGYFGSAASGNITSHQLTLGGDLVNDGTLDLSTNGSSAGAEIVFTGASNNIFGGTGPVTDVRKIRIDKGTSAANTLEFTMSNFTVQGSTTDTPASGYLTLANGTFKISGAFTGNHRTFDSGYGLPVNVGLWVNNPNHTIEGQPGSVELRGNLKVSAGNYNVGSGIDDSLIIYPNINITIEGGTIGTAGRFSVWTPDTPFFYTQTGGTVVTCKVGQTSVDFACFDMGTGAGFVMLQVILAGGDIVIQNAASAAAGPRDYRNRTTGGIYNMTGTSLVFGNENTSGPSNFAAFGDLPNVIINTAAGGHTLTLLRPNEGPYRNNSRDVEIGPGGTFDIGDTDYFMQGNRFVNNGTLNATGPNAAFVWFGADSSPAYYGSGVSAGVMTYMDIIADQLVLDPAINNIRVRKLQISEGNVINAYKLTLGNNDAVTSEILIGAGGAAPPAALDSSPVFELGTGGQSVSYLRSPNAAWTTGPEINPQRILVDLTFNAPPPSTLFLNINGGDITVNRNLVLTWGTVLTGSNKITHNGTVARQNGWVEGTVERIYTGPGSYTYPVGAGGAYSPVTATVSSLAGSPSSLSVKAVNSTLPGLPGAFSVSRYWSVLETGDLTASLVFKYDDTDINGDESTYRTWRSNGVPPVFVSGSTADPGANTVTSAPGLTELTGDWGLGMAPVSVSGRILTSGGTPIRNAILTLTGGSLSAPRVFQTGNFGAYVFDDLRAGETYTLRIGAKRYRFAQLSWEIIPQGNITNLDFVANPQD